MTAPAERVLELRSYRLHPGKREAFHHLFEERALPMLRAAGIDVVAYGPSADSAEGYFLMRSFPTLDERRRALDAFYGSPAWLAELDEKVMARIDTYHTIVVPAPASTVEALRQLGRITSAGAGSA